MATATKEARDTLQPAKNFLLFGFLFILSLAFFASVRNNTFWHSSDYLYLDQALDTQQSWTQIFVSSPTQPFQPLVRLIFFLEYTFFGFDAWKYYLFNIFIHSINAFLVYFLVFTLLRDRTISMLSSVLFAFAVGNYGKAVMVVSGISDLLITMLSLLTLWLYFKNELEKGGRVFSFWFITSLICFLLSLVTKATSFSVLGCMLAFNIFFRSEIKKRVLNRDFLIIAAFALAALITKLIYLPDLATQNFDVVNRSFVRNYGSYLVRMVFPIHSTRLVPHAGPAVQFIYQLATEIRVVTFLTILSYTVFGFVFGNRTIRFFILWTYITVTPFTFFNWPTDWLNIRYLYLVSIGFILLLAYGTVLASRLLYEKRWRRLLPYLAPLLFVFLSQFIIRHLDWNYETTAATPAIERLRSDVMTKYESLRLEE